MNRFSRVVLLLTIAAILGAPAPSSAWPIPDTGQTQCYVREWNGTKWTWSEGPCPQPGEPLYGQDGNYLINAPSYTKLDENGNDLADDAIDWVMVRDNVTGLIWEVKTDDGSIHDKDNTYMWHSAQDVFIAALNNTEFGGHSDWRLPNIKELKSIVNYGSYNPSINTFYFPSTVSSYYWSSTTGAGDTGGAWSVYFYLGYDYWGYKSNYYYVRAVRAGQSGSFDHYVEPAGTCGGKTPCYKTIGEALTAAAGGDTIQAAKTLAPEEPVWAKTGMVTISGGWKTDFSAKDGTTSMYAPRVTGGGGVKVQPNVKIIPKP